MEKAKKLTGNKTAYVTKKPGAATQPNINLRDLLERLETTTGGLTQEEAQNRLARYGYNELSEKKVNPILKFASYFWGPIPWMIEVAIILSALVHHWVL